MAGNKDIKSASLVDGGAPFDVNHVRIESVRLLYQGVYTAALVNLGLAALIIWGLWGWVSHSAMLTWFAVLLVITGFRVILSWQFEKADPASHKVSVWLVMLIAINSLVALVWGLSIWIFEPFINHESSMLLTFLVGGLTAGAAALQSVVLSSFVIYVLLIMGPITLWHFVQASQSHMVMALMLCVYTLAMLSAGIIYRRVTLRSIILANELASAKKLAEVANQYKSEFLTRISHELRTPLNAILGFAQILQMEEGYSKENKQGVNEIVRGGNHLLQLIDGLLDLARIEAGAIELSTEVVSCRELIHECVDQISPLCRHANISVIVDMHGEKSVFVWADRLKLKQIIFNLLSNACKYNRRDGSITIQCNEMNNAHVCIAIRDTGIGIADEQQENLFRSFERLGKEKSKIEGTGLGLAIVKQFVDVMNGTISFQSTANVGTEFTICLPVPDDENFTQP